MKKIRSLFALILALLMTALCITACGPADDTEAIPTQITVTVEVVGSNGQTTAFTIETTETTLRGVLEQEDLVKGEDGPYGLYIHEVNGERAVYETDGAYWAVYEGDVAAMTGVDDIKLTDGGTYKLVYTKG